MDDASLENFPDRPLECGKCKKPVMVQYTEIIGKSITRLCMCADCPELQRRLHGSGMATIASDQLENIAGLCCGACGTTLQEVRRGHLLGCNECYEVFGDTLITELLAANKLPARFVGLKNTVPLHIGRAPGENILINLSSRLLALNEALNETLGREDYEQAAWLRDQIRALTENNKKDNISSSEEKNS